MPLALTTNYKANAILVRSPAKAVYQQIIAEGLHVGSTFMPMQQIALGQQEALSTLILPESIIETFNDYVLHPSLLTGVFQTALISNRFIYTDDIHQYIPVAIDELTLYQPLTNACYVYSYSLPQNKSETSLRKFNLLVYNEEGQISVALNGFSLKGIQARPTFLGDTNMQEKKSETMQAVVHITLAAGENYLKELIANAIAIDPNEMNVKTSFEKYGINSIMIMGLNVLLEQKFGLLSKTLFFEYSNISELAAYFLEHHQERLIVLLGSIPADETIMTQQSEAKVITQAAVVMPPPIVSVPQDIAIIGLSGRYPGANNMEEFWALLTAGKDCITEIPIGRFAYKDYFDSDRNQQKIYSKWGGFINDVDKFDPLFFNIPPQEAELIDPQERLFLEVVWETLEDAGYTKESLTQKSKQIGVFVGA